MRTTLFKATQSATVPNAVNISTPREKMTTQSTIPSQISELTEISDGPKLTPKPLETSTQTSLHQKPTNQLISNWPQFGREDKNSKEIQPKLLDLHTGLEKIERMKFENEKSVDNLSNSW